MPALPRSLPAAALLAAAVFAGAACGDGNGEVTTDSTVTSAPQPPERPGSTRPAVETLPGMPPVVDASNLYSEASAGKFAPGTDGAKFLVYVPNEASNTLTVIDPRTYSVVATWPMRMLPQHVVPSYNMSKLWVLNNEGDAVTPIDPLTGEPGTAIDVEDPYNLYYLPDGREAIIVEEANEKLAFVDPVTFEVRGPKTEIACKGFNHLDFSADGRYMVGSCEFDAQMIRIDTVSRQVVGRFTLDLAATGQTGLAKTIAQPQDVRVANDGEVFYVADIVSNGVFVIDADSFTQIGFIPTGIGAHGLYPSRDGEHLYVVNRGTSTIPPVGSFKGKAQGSVSVIDFASRTVTDHWEMPGGGSPDMGALTPDGGELWLGGRYDAEVYVFDTGKGELTRRIPAGQNPHGLTVWPQPGRYSLGHTANAR